METNKVEMSKSIMQDVINDVYKERERQNEKWGEQNHNPVEWIAILTEEVGEAAREAVDYYFVNNTGFMDIQTEREVQAERLENYKKELIQVAAVAIQAIECLIKQQQNN